MDKITHQARIEQWTNIINECLASGMNKTAWCKQNGISDKAFFYWQRIIRKETYCTAELPAPSEFSKDSFPKASFVELRTEPSVSTDASNDQIFRPDMIIRKNDLVLEISNSVSPELLSQIGVLFNAQ